MSSLLQIKSGVSSFLKIVTIFFGDFNSCNINFKKSYFHYFECCAYVQKLNDNALLYGKMMLNVISL